MGSTLDPRKPMECLQIQNKDLKDYHQYEAVPTIAVIRVCE